MKRLWWLLVMIVFLIIADQMSKGYIETNYQVGETTEVIKNFFHITYVQNRGAFWGIGQDWSETARKFVFLFLSTGIALFVFYLLFKSLKDVFIQSFAYALIIAGAIGNLIDRYVLGFVIDMFDFFIVTETQTHRWAVFNVADACISVAIALLIIDEVFLAKKRKAKA